MCILQDPFSNCIAQEVQMVQKLIGIKFKDIYNYTVYIGIYICISVYNAVEREQSGTQFPGQGTHLMFPPGKAVNIGQ